MSDRKRTRPTPSSGEIPRAVRDIALRLADNRFDAWFVGESLHTLCTGSQPAAFEISTSASLAQSLALFPTAVPTDAGHGISTVPARGTNVDLVPFQRGASAPHDLSHRDFTIFAMAWAPATAEFLDPHAGLRDMQRGSLRCVGEASACLALDPVRALRAARLVASHPYEADAELEAALPSVGPQMRHLRADRARRELIRMLLAEHPSHGIRLLRRTGLERRFFKPVRADEADLVDELPAALHLRMAAWLRGASTSRTLRTLRFGVERSRRIERLLAYHPLDEQVAPSHDRSVSRMLRLLPEEDIRALFWMREWELTHDTSPGRESGESSVDVEAVRKRLAEIERAMQRVIGNRARTSQRMELALGGEEIMRILDCPPGRRVGAAILFLGERVREHPELNQPDLLQGELLTWTQRESGPDER